MFGQCQSGLLVSSLFGSFGPSLMCLALLNPLGKRQELHSIGAEDPKIVVARPQDFWRTSAKTITGMETCGRALRRGRRPSPNVERGRFCDLATRLFGWARVS